ncbi:MAG: YfhO family protein [Candidatus Obscuribacter sp.]|nr:YfhO family protein [Candidatus Obscuribacter sp.]
MNEGNHPNRTELAGSKLYWRLLAFSALAGLVYLAVIFSGSLFSGAILAYEDGRVQNYPAFASPGTLWTPLLCCGLPVLADPQVSTFYPLMQLCRLLPFGYNWYVLSAYLIAFVSSTALAYRLSRSRYGALIAGVVYGGSGFLISELNHVQIVHTVALLPLLLLFADLVSAGKKQAHDKRLGLKALALTVLVACSIFAGHPQTCFYGLFLTALYPLFGKSRKGAGWLMHFTQAVLPVWLCLFAGVLLAAVQLLPSLELSQLSYRTHFAFSDFLTGQLGFNDFLGFAFPYVLGGRYGTLQGMTVVNQGPPPGYLFFGFAPLLLSLFMIVKSWREPVVRFFAVVWLLAFAFVLGNATPLAQLVYMIPGFGSFRGLYRMLLMVSVAVAMLTALAIARLEILSKRPGTSGAFDLSKLIARHGIKRHLYFMLYLILGGLSYNFLLGTLPLLIYLLAPLKKYRQLFLLATVSLSLMTYGMEADWKHNVVTWASMQAPVESAKLKDTLQKEQTRIFTLKGLEGGEHEFLPNLSRLWGVPNASGYEPLVPWRYARLLHMAEGGFIQPPWLFTAENRAFDVASIKYVIAPEVEVTPRIIDENAKDAWTYLQPDRGAAYLENKRVLPRYRFATRVVAVTDDMAVNAIRTGQYPGGVFDPVDTVLLARLGDGMASAAEAQLPSSAGAPPAELKYSNLVESDTSSKLHVSLSQPAYLVISDQYYPGWTATVDGAETHLLRANLCFRAIKLDKGEHDVAMEYKPESLRLAYGVSGVGLVLLLLMLLV